MKARLVADDFRGVFGPDSAWTGAGLSLEQDPVDIARPERSALP